jgi:hypothetical protein
VLQTKYRKWVVSCGVMTVLLSWLFLPLNTHVPVGALVESARIAGKQEAVDVITGSTIPITIIYVLALKDSRVSEKRVHECLLVGSSNEESLGVEGMWVLLHLIWEGGTWRRYQAFDVAYGLGISHYSFEPSISHILQNQLFWRLDRGDMRVINIVPSEWVRLFGRKPRNMDIVVERFRRLWYRCASGTSRQATYEMTR